MYQTENPSKWIFDSLLCNCKLFSFPTKSDFLLLLYFMILMTLQETLACDPLLIWFHIQFDSPVG